MCGISGIASRQLKREDLRNTIERMACVLGHRGPDGLEIRSFLPPVVSRPVALAHNRLAIIDLSPAGREPMSNEEETIWLVFNGEIYNFPELRARLEEQGHRFRSRTDAEVILHLYEEREAECVRHLNGIFAFVLLDLRRDRLFLARDPVGVKPLFYCSTPDHFLFASEIKAILAASVSEVRVSWQAVSDYFTYLYVPGPETMFEGILQLAPGHCLTLDLAANTLRRERYWTVRRNETIAKASYEDLKCQVREVLAASVKRQLVSDVPLGVFLSGGVDSTIVAGLAKKDKTDIRTYTVVFPGKEYTFYDQAKRGRAVSRHLGTEHRELRVSETDPAEIFALVEYFDQPFGNPTSYLMYLLSKQAREHITVALCGAGGDELYAGYPRYGAIRLARRLGWIPQRYLRLGKRALARVRDSYRTMHLKRARKFFEGLHPDFLTQYAQWTYFLNEEKKAKLLRRQNQVRPSLEVLRAALEGSSLSDPDNRILHMDLQTFLTDNILEYTDRMSMAVALEVRVPLLDTDLVEFSLNVPFAYKVRRGRTKLLLKDAFAEFFPPGIRDAPKRGFNAPLAQWVLRVFDQYFEASGLPAHPLRDQLGGDIGVVWREGILDWNFIQQLRKQHFAGEQDNSYELFAIILFDVWWRKYVTRTLPTAHW